MRASGQDAAITLYPGAHHAFDNITLGYVHLANADNGAGCTLRLASILGPLPSASDVAGCLRKARRSRETPTPRRVPGATSGASSSSS
jgi:hypothetical protein